MQGLALPALAKDAWQMPAFFRMIQQGMLRDPVFSVWMDPNPNAVPAGEVLFGGADPSRFTGHLHFIRVISQKCALISPAMLLGSRLLVWPTRYLHAASHRRARHLPCDACRISVWPIYYLFSSHAAVSGARVFSPCKLPDTIDQ